MAKEHPSRTLSQEWQGATHPYHQQTPQARSGAEPQPGPAARSGKRPHTTAPSRPQPAVAGNRTQGPQPGVARNTHNNRQQNPARTGGEWHSGPFARSGEGPTTAHTSHTQTYTSSKPPPRKPAATHHTCTHTHTHTNTHGRHTRTNITTTNTTHTHQHRHYTHAPRQKHTQHGVPPTQPDGNGHRRGRRTLARSGREPHPGPSARSGEGPPTTTTSGTPLRGVAGDCSRGPQSGVARERPPRTLSKKQGAIRHHHTPQTSGPQPGVAKAHPPATPEDPSQEWRGATPQTLSQE